MGEVQSGTEFGTESTSAADEVSRSTTRHTPVGDVRYLTEAHHHTSSVGRFGLEDADEFAQDDGVGQRAVLQIDVGEEVVVERLQEFGDFFLGPTGAFQQDHGARHRAAGEVMQIDGSGLLAVYLAGLVLGNRPLRAYSAIITFHDAVTWLCQIVMFVLLGLLVSPHKFIEYWIPAVCLMFIARPAAVILCLTPFRYPWREKIFISWVGLRGAVGVFLASIPVLA